MTCKLKIALLSAVISSCSYFRADNNSAQRPGGLSANKLLESIPCAVKHACRCVLNIAVSGKANNIFLLYIMQEASNQKFLISFMKYTY